MLMEIRLDNYVAGFPAVIVTLNQHPLALQLFEFLLIVIIACRLGNLSRRFRDLPCRFAYPRVASGRPSTRNPTTSVTESRRNMRTSFSGAQTGFTLAEEEHHVTLALPSPVIAHAVLTLAMPAGSPRQRVDDRHLEKGNLACQAPRHLTYPNLPASAREFAEFHGVPGT